MPVEHQDIAEPGVMHAANGVVEQPQPTAGRSRQRADVPHVVLADADVHGRRDDDLRAASLGDGDGNVHHAPPVVFHGQMLQVLLGGRHRNDAGLELPGLHPLTELAAGVFGEQNFRAVAGGHGAFSSIATQWTVQWTAAARETVDCARLAVVEAERVADATPLNRAWTVLRAAHPHGVSSVR